MLFTQDTECTITKYSSDNESTLPRHLVLGNLGVGITSFDSVHHPESQESIYVHGSPCLINIIIGIAAHTYTRTVQPIRIQLYLGISSKVGRGNSGHGIVRGNSGHFNVATGKKHPFYSCF